MSAQKICALVPTFNNPLTIARVARELLARGLEVVIVDDGSEEPGRNAAAEVAAEEGVHLLARAQNGVRGVDKGSGVR